MSSPGEGERVLPESESHPTGTLIAGRYRVQRKLGGGGVAVVYEVLDESSGQRLALKRPEPRSNPELQRRVQELFAREFHTMSQLAHPRIVAVYDYGHDARGPYYTMELLEGGDLSQLLRADYRRVCAIARDVCSALSLLHSRRVLHRDVSARNVRCGADGTAKLIDFGAMTLIGPSKELVGTPAYAAPELVNLQPLDARTDLYALGATLYYALTGHHAYPVRDFASLPNAWNFAVTRPSEIAPGIPQGLETLVLDLLQLEPRNRPSSAAEVMERLAAIEGRPVDEQLLVAQAYLTTPAFVGREPELEQVRNACQRTLRKRGSAVLVQGAAGVGRSRFLDASVLAAKLLGMTVIRADADAAQHGEYGTVRALLSQLHKALPDVAASLADGGERELLGTLMPELFGTDAPAAPAYTDPAALRPQLQAAIRQALLHAASGHPLLIAVDDVQRVDEPSLAALALLSRGLRNAGIAIVATAESGALASGGSAFRVYDDQAVRVTLEPLNALETRSLLGSVFGDSQNLDLLVHRLDGVAQGNPRALMRLAQHLVDRKLVRYRAGAWSLPARIDTSDLPDSVAQVLRSRAQALGPGARRLARALALCPELSFNLEECCLLSEQSEPGRVMGYLAQLVEADIVRTSGERLALTDRAWLPVLREELADADRRTIHLLLAKLFEQRGLEDFRVAQHLLRAGEREAAVAGLVGHAIRSTEITDRSPEEFFKLICSLPDDWLQTYEEGLELARVLGRPRHELHALRARLTGLVAVIGLRDTRHVRTLIADLSAASGLTDWATVDPTLDAMPRLVKALETAQARYDGAPEAERMLAPVAAIRALARGFITAVGMSMPTLDLAALRALPSLAPLTPLSPALSAIELLVAGVCARLSGRADQAHELYKTLLERTGAPDRAGFDESHHRYMRAVLMNGVGMLEASMGLGSSLQWAQQIETEPLFKVNAVLVRMLYQLWQGNCVEAERDKDQLNALRIASSARQNFENTHLVWQITAHAQMEDLTRLKRTIDEIATSGGDHPGWQPVLAYGQAEHRRVRGDAPGAVTELESALSVTRAGEHQIWAELAGAHVRALDESGRGLEAVSHGCSYLEQAAAAELDWGSNTIRLPLAIARGKLGQPEGAREVEQVIDRLLARGTTGLNLTLAFEARARIAVACGDASAYEQYGGLLQREAQRVGNSALSAKAQKLKREAQQRQLTSAGPLSSLTQRRAVGKSLLQSKLEACGDADERARVTLALLGEYSGASEGHLYRMTEGGLVWSASLGTSAPPGPALEAMAHEYIAAEIHGHEITTGASHGIGVSTQWTLLGEASLRPVLLSHYVDEVYVVSGLAVFALRPDVRFVYPIEVAAEISRLAVEAGDAQAVSVESS